MRSTILAVLVLAAACSLDQKMGAKKQRVEELLPDLVIGEVMSFTGPEAAYGYAARDGIELALRQYNEEGGVHGRHVVARIQDDRDSEKHALVAFDRLVANAKAEAKPVAVIGATSSNITLALAPLAQKAKIPLITPSSTSPGVTAANDFVFRSCFQDDFQGHAMATFATKTLSKKLIAVLHVDRSYSKGLASSFVKSVKALGAEVVLDEEFKPKTKDYRPQLKAALAKKADALFLPMSYSDAAPIMVQAKEVGLTATLLGGDGWDSPRLFEATEGAVEGAYFSTHFAADGATPAVKKFVKDFSDAFGYEPNGPAAMGYEVGRLVVSAARKVKTLDGPSMREALAIAKLDGLAGDFAMTPTRDPVKPAYVLQVKDGQPKFVELVQ